MAIEIEAKLKVPELAGIRQTLVDAGAKQSGQYFETNTFFDTPDRVLLAADRGLRLRQAHDSLTGHERTILTYKGPRQQGPLKSREENEVDVGSYEKAVDLLQSLGYEITLSFQKRRQSWELDQCEVELDELPLLGTYVEVEGPDEQAVMHVIQKLGLASRPIEKHSYIAMIADYIKQHGMTERSITFPAHTHRQ